MAGEEEIRAPLNSSLHLWAVAFSVPSSPSRKKLQLQLQDLVVSVQGSVDPIISGIDQGKYAITGIEIYVYAKVEGDQDEKDIAEDCIRLTEEHCPIAFALRKSVPIKIVSQIETTDS